MLKALKPKTLHKTLHRTGLWVLGQSLQRWTSTVAPCCILWSSKIRCSVCHLTLQHLPPLSMSPCPSGGQVDANNAQLLEQHVCCASAELPVTLEQDSQYFGPGLSAAMDALVNQGQRKLPLF